MPTMDGFEATKLIKSDLQLQARACRRAFSPVCVLSEAVLSWWR